VLGHTNRRSQKSGITTTVIDDADRARRVFRRMRDAGIDVSLRQTRAGMQCLRLSPHFYNLETEIDEVVKNLLS